MRVKLIISTITVLIILIVLIVFRKDGESFCYIKMEVRNNVVGPSKEFKISARPVSGNEMFNKTKHFIDKFEQIDKKNKREYVIPDSPVACFEISDSRRNIRFCISSILFLNKKFEIYSNGNDIFILAQECIHLMEDEFYIPREILLEKINEYPDWIKKGGFNINH